MSPSVVHFIIPSQEVKVSQRAFFFPLLKMTALEKLETDYLALQLNFLADWLHVLLVKVHRNHPV